MLSPDTLREINGLYSRLIKLRENIRRDEEYILGLHRIEQQLRSLGLDPGSSEIPPKPPENPVYSQLAKAA